MACKECDKFETSLSLKKSMIGDILQCRHCEQCFKVVKVKSKIYLKTVDHHEGGVTSIGNVSNIKE